MSKSMRNVVRQYNERLDSLTRDGLLLTNQKGHVVFEAHKHDALTDQYMWTTVAGSESAQYGSFRSMVKAAMDRWKAYPAADISGKHAGFLTNYAADRADCRYLVTAKKYQHLLKGTP